jgi:hypothetical protein
MDFKNFTSKVLKDIVKKYELHYIKEFEGYATFGKRELVNKIKKHLYIEGDLIKQKKEPFSIDKPLTTQEKKDKKKAKEGTVDDDIQDVIDEKEKKGKKGKKKKKD